MLKPKYNKWANVSVRVCLVSLLQLIAFGAIASELQSQTYMTFGIQDYELEYLDSSDRGAPIAVNLPMFSIGGAVTYGQWFTDINVGQSIKRSSKSGSISSNSSSINSVERDTYRRHFSISSGYVFSNGFVAFIGYKQSESNFYEETVTSQDNGGIPTLNKTAAATEFKNSGPFVGGAYGFAVTERSILSFHGALGRFAGEVSSEDPEIIKSDDLSTTGISLGIKTKLILTEDFDTTIGADWREYEYSGKSGADLYRERVMNLQLQVSYVF